MILGSVFFLIAAAVSLAVRALPLTMIRKRIENRFIRSFLFYVPYVTLAVMTFPAMIDAAAHPAAGIAALAAGTAAAALIAERYNLHIRKISKKAIRKENYGQKLFDLINSTYSKLYDFTVFPPDVVEYYINAFLGVLNFKYVTLVEDAEGRLIAMALSMPSIAHAVKKGNGYLFPLGWWYLLKSLYIKHEEALELMLIAVDPEYQNRGVHAMLFNEIIPNLIAGGFQYGESNAEMETNTKVQNIWNTYRKDFKRRRRVFSKEI